eukprot:7550193-Alexandrium_andersonii.AAC.1
MKFLGLQDHELGAPGPLPPRRVHGVAASPHLPHGGLWRHVTSQEGRGALLHQRHGRQQPHDIGPG